MTDKDWKFSTFCHFAFFIYYYYFLFKHIITQCLLQEFQRLIEGDYTTYKSNIAFGSLKEFRAEKLKVAVPKLGLAFPQHHPQKLTAALPLMKLTEIESSITLDTRIMYRRFLANGSKEVEATMQVTFLAYFSILPTIQTLKNLHQKWG